MRAIWAIACGMIRELIRKKDFYVLMIFLLVLLSALASQSIFHIEGISRYIRDFGYSMVMFFSFVISVTFCAKQLPGEIEARTIYPLLAKPLSRYAVILGKFCGGVAVSILSFVLFFSVFGAFYMFGGDRGSFVLLAQGFLFGGLFLCLVSAMVIFFSNIMTMSANVTVSFLLYVMVNGFSNMLRDSAISSGGLSSLISGTIYYLMPHFDFYDMRIRLTHAWDPLALWVVTAVTVYTLAYCFMLLYFAGLLFRRKRL